LTTAAIAAGLSCTDVVDWWFPRRVGTSVGRREGTGDGGARGCRRVVVVGLTAVVVAALFRAAAPVASRGILFGAWPLPERSVLVVVIVIVVDATPTVGFLFAAAAAVERVTLVGPCSDAVTRGPIVRV